MQSVHEVRRLRSQGKAANIGLMEGLRSKNRMASSLRQSYEERDQIEQERFQEDERRKRGMAIALVPLGISMAMIMHYTNIVVVIDDSDWQYVLHRPNFTNILRLSIAPFIGGGVAMLAAAMVATSVAGREGWFLPHALMVACYSLFMPLLVGVLLPANLFLLNIAGLSAVDVSIREALSAWIWGTPFFVLEYTLTGIKQAFWAGMTAALVCTFIFRYIGPNCDSFSIGKTTAVTTLVAVLAAVVMMFGPLPIFELLFNQFRIT